MISLLTSPRQMVYGQSESATVGYEVVVSQSNESPGLSQNQKEPTSFERLVRGILPDLGVKEKKALIIFGIIICLITIYFYMMKRRKHD
jgi:hypothetical protein